MAERSFSFISVYIMAMITGAFWNIIAQWVHRGMTVPPDEIISTITTYWGRLA